MDAVENQRQVSHWRPQPLEIAYNAIPTFPQRRRGAGKVENEKHVSHFPACCLYIPKTESERSPGGGSLRSRLQAHPSIRKCCPSAEARVRRHSIWRQTLIIQRLPLNRSKWLTIERSGENRYPLGRPTVRSVLKRSSHRLRVILGPAHQTSPSDRQTGFRKSEIDEGFWPAPGTAENVSRRHVCSGKG